MSFKIRKIAVIGLGLIGGSLVQLIRQKNPDLGLVGWDPDSQTQTDAAPFLDRMLPDLLAVTQEEDLDLIVIASPISEVVELVKSINQNLEDPVIFLDVASTKAEICSQLSDLPGPGIFIGGHPMAGSEQTGFLSASADLLQGARFVLTPSRPTGVTAVQGFLSELGFAVSEMDPEIHDQVVGLISHMPFLMAHITTALAQDLGQDLPLDTLASSGFRDTTRLAAGSGEWGGDVIKTNSKTMLQGIETAKQGLTRLEDWIKAGEMTSIQDWFLKNKQFRDQFYS